MRHRRKINQLTEEARKVAKERIFKDAAPTGGTCLTHNVFALKKLVLKAAECVLIKANIT